jgi:hypothetical protein
MMFEFWGQNVQFYVIDHCLEYHGQYEVFLEVSQFALKVLVLAFNIVYDSQHSEIHLNRYIHFYYAIYSVMMKWIVIRIYILPAH